MSDLVACLGGPSAVRLYEASRCGQEQAVQIDLHKAPEGAAVVALQGRFDRYTAPGFRQRIRDLLAAGNTHIVIDLNEVDFLDSSGLGAMLSALRAFNDAGGDLRIARPNLELQMMLEMTALSRLLHPYQTLADALADL
jgi:anti-sigma B factor antagonist